MRSIIGEPITIARKIENAQIRKDARWGTAEFDKLNAANAAAVAQAKLRELGDVRKMDKATYEAAKKLARSRGAYNRR
jgi:hypothetical protein